MNANNGIALDRGSPTQIEEIGEVKVETNPNLPIELRFSSTLTNNTKKTFWLLCVAHNIAQNADLPYGVFEGEIDFLLNQKLMGRIPFTSWDAFNLSPAIPDATIAAAVRNKINFDSWLQDATLLSEDEKTMLIEADTTSPGDFYSFVMLPRKYTVASDTVIVRVNKITGVNLALYPVTIAFSMRSEIVF